MNPKYVIAYPLGGRAVPVDWHLSVRQIMLPSNVRTSEIIRRAHVNSKGEWIWALEDSQTSMAEQALEMGAEYILYIEDDTIPPPNCLMDLARVLENSDESVMACGGIYTTRSNPPEPMVYLGPGLGCHWNWKVGEVFKCWSMGFGCTMVRTKIFELMPKPWFKELKTWADVRMYPELFDAGPEPPPGAEHRTGTSTDFFFFQKLHKMGFTVLAHGGVLPVHHDMATGKSYWLPANCGPTEGIIVDGKPYGWTPEVVKV